MKKALLILLAFALVFGLVFTGCPNGSTKGPAGPDDPPTDPSLPEVEVTGDEIVLYAIGTKQPTITGNKVKYSGADAGVTGSGFAYDFPDEVIGKGYWKVNVEMEVVSITNPNFISFNAKDSNQMGTDVLIFGHTAQYHNELKLGEIDDKDVGDPCGDKTVCLTYTAGSCKVDATGSADYPFSAFKNDMIAFQYNPWAGDITTDGWTDSSGKPDFEIAVTKITFIPAAGSITKLPAPVIALDGTTGIKWEAVTGAAGYDVYADDEQVGTTLAASATSINLNTSALAARPGDPYDMTVVAVATPGINEDSDPSNIVQFEKNPPVINSFTITGAGTVQISEVVITDDEKFTVLGVEGGIQINGGNWDWAIVKIPVTLTGGKTAGDIKKVTLKLTGVSGGPTAYKDYYIFIGDPIPSGQVSTANAANNTKFSTGDVANGTTIDVSFDIDNLGTGLGTKTSFEFSIWANMQNASYQFTNIAFTF